MNSTNTFCFLWFTRAISRYLFPPMLNMVRLPTKSAEGKSAFTSARLSQAARFATAYQPFSALKASGCFAENSRIALRLITLRLLMFAYCEHSCQGNVHGS